MVRLSSLVSCRGRLRISDLFLLMVVTISSFICEIQSSVTTKSVRSKRSEPTQSLPAPFVSSSLTSLPELPDQEATSPPASGLDTVQGGHVTLQAEPLLSSSHDQKTPIREKQTSQSCLSSSAATQTIGESRSFGALTQMPYLEAISYSSHGDINIGHFARTHERRGFRCVPGQNNPEGLLFTQAMTYAVRAVNSDPEVLPGIKLGFVQVPICREASLSLAQALSFLPRVKGGSVPGNDPLSCRPALDVSDRGTDATPSLSRTMATTESTTTDSDNPSIIAAQSPVPMPYYDVIGVIGPPTSAETVGVSRLLGSAHIPVIGVSSTSDELSDKSHHPYFLRVVAPDKYQVEAMLTFITEHGWSFISVLYVEGSYGEAAFEHIKNLAAELDVCIAVSFRIGSSGPDMNTVARGLLKRGRARVVILFLYTSHCKRLLRSVASLNATGHFIWLASDGWAPENRINMEGLEKEAVGAFSFKYQSEFIPNFYRHAAEVMLGIDRDDDGNGRSGKNTVDGSSTGSCTQEDNVMADLVREAAWTAVTNCPRIDTELSGPQQCVSRENATVEAILSKIAVSPRYSLTVDAVWTFALAAHKLISEHCPGATGRRARECIRGDILLEYLKEMSFNGSSGAVKFDSSGDAAGRYLVKQVFMGPKQDLLGLGIDGSQDIGLNARIVAFYDIDKKRMGFTENSISWNHLERVDSLSRQKNLQDYENTDSGESEGEYEYYNGEASQDRYLYNDMDYGDLEEGSTPESVCSRPCRPGEFVILREPAPCCWECRACRDNERVVRGNTSCERCGEFTWPDPSTGYRTCTAIPVTHPQIYELLPTLQIFLGVLALVISILIVACYVYFRESRVIKAASRELSVLQMAATFIGFITVILFQMPPDPFTCGALYFLFCLSFALLYCPLLVKAVRIYRIFNSTAKSTRRPRFVSPACQVIMTVCLVVVQVILCLYVFFVYRPTAQKIQPALTEKFVELSCDMTLPGLASFLAYNLVLVFLCSVFAFKTRKLPDNFNESHFICMCVSTTLVIWLAFVPTYFTSNMGRVRVLLLSLALLLNHTVALVFLFAPKIYAAVFVAEENFVVTRFQPRDSRLNTVTATRFASSTATEGVGVSATVSSGFHSNNRVAPSPQLLAPSQGF